MEAPGAGNHPVSGTRQFGFETVPSRSGPSYNFFVRGVDRFDSNIIQNFANVRFLGEPFTGADDLWESFQNNLDQFVNANNGTSFTIEPIKNRPDWGKVMDVLEGKEPISSLGCK